MVARVLPIRLPLQLAQARLSREADLTPSIEEKSYRWTVGLTKMSSLEYKYNQDYLWPSMTQMVGDRSPSPTVYAG